MIKATKALRTLKDSQKEAGVVGGRKKARIWNLLKPQTDVMVEIMIQMNESN